MAQQKQKASAQATRCVSAFAAAAGASMSIAGIAGGLIAASAYSEARRYVVQHRNVCLGLAASEQSGAHSQPGVYAQLLRILHLSDFHAMAYNHKLLRFVRELRQYEPNLLIFTGDFIAQEQAIEPLLAALSAFKGTPGVFVYGSNDYYAPKPKNPFRYLVHNSNEGTQLSEAELAALALPTAALTTGLEELGFINLNNQRATINLGSHILDFVGVDDPHIDRDSYPGEGSEASRQSLRIGVTHAPYRRILNQMCEEGCQLVFAGHTHGGQVCLPGQRSLVTNCDLPPRLASGLFEWPTVLDESIPSQVLKGDGKALLSASYEGAERTIVQISAGLGTTPFVPLRTFCRPEAIVMDVEFAGN